MKNVSTKKLLISAIVLPLCFSGAVMAQAKKSDAYLVDDRAVPARNSTNLCWHTTDWTPAKAIYECEPDLVPKKMAATTPPPAPVSAPAPAPVSVPSKMHFSADELFDFDKAVIKHSPSRDQLEEFAARVKILNFNSISVTGYTDRIGSAEYNKRLSLRRANAVKNHLVSHGVDGSKIKVEGRGESDSITGDRCKGNKANKALISCLQPDRRVLVEVDGTRDTK
jgi:OOP family OmpA-OmpF porin